jgi:hypothetical protein
MRLILIGFDSMSVNFYDIAGIFCFQIYFQPYTALKFRLQVNIDLG